MLKSHFVLKAKTMGMVLTGTVLVLFSAPKTFAYNGPEAGMAANDKARELQGVGIDEKLGHKLDLGMTFKDETGKDVALRDYFDGKHPIILSPVYFKCPGLCNFHLNGLTDALKVMEKNWTVGDKFKVVAISFDSKETPEDAATKKALYMKMYDRAGSEGGWHFLTGNDQQVRALTESIGFKFRWDETQKEWAHASAAVVVSPDGTVSRYLPGIMFNQQDIKLALNEATEGKIGSFVDSLVLYCFKYDPHKSKYSLAAVSVMKLGGGVMVLVMVLWLLPLYIRSRRAKKNVAGR
ncbi:SCO family protein [Bdellovibrio sp. SKB1291214]|uniref:SCO family protein n=1 Tax=Bdellovibrio sp. SKB1291214 TaxID=1732569 RepID=UPI000B516F7F|nr:SCO family protein [Bdellovibrio sp. SKB1291214]UYL10328.1 SCO family protein [Bdellovibrio sp. SKB1291214]